MSLLDAQTAASLQFVTLPLEFVGLLLATIEVRFPERARAIAEWVADMADTWREARAHDRSSLAETLQALRDGRFAHAGRRFTHWFSRDPNLQAPLFRYVMTWLLAGIVVQFMVRAGLGLLPDPGTPLSDVQLQTTAALQALHDALRSMLVAGALIAGPGFVALQIVSVFSERFVAGRAVGTLGIVLALLGLVGEVYQLAVQILL